MVVMKGCLGSEDLVERVLADISTEPGSKDGVQKVVRQPVFGLGVSIYHVRCITRIEH